MKQKNIELRQDIITGEWVIISPNRSKNHLNIKKVKRTIEPKDSDPFWDPQKNGNEKPLFVKPNLKNWKVQILPNKYPALTPHIKIKEYQQGPYKIASSFGFHEVILTKSQHQNFCDLSSKDALTVFQGVKERYKYMKVKKVKYAMMFQNWGPKAGATVAHPHYQIVGLPIIPPKILNSIAGAKKYYQKHKSYIYSDVIKYEKKHKSRIVFENKYAISFTRFASREPFDIKVFPKKHISEFTMTDNKTLEGFVEVLQTSLSKIQKNIKDPDYNFYIHSSPLDKVNKYYHWHIDIIPKISISGGVEQGLGVEITAIDPDEAATILKK